MFYLHILFMVIWHWTYGKGPLRLLERKPGPTSIWVIIFD